MTAPFARELCGYRENGNPSTSDSNDPLSIEFGHALFETLGVERDTPERSQVGPLMEKLATEHLSSLRPDLAIATSRRTHEFEQYEHLAVFRDFARAYRGPATSLRRDYERLIPSVEEPEIRRLLESALKAELKAQVDHELITQLLDTMPEESLLRIDITIADHRSSPRLLLAVTSKWSLRTDRAQDCVSQGSKLVNLRRGSMPHFSVLTMEPRPSMLRLIAYSSGAVDCVYYLALPELREAAEQLEMRRDRGPWKPRLDLERMISQRRIRDYDELVAETMALPKATAP